MALLPQDPKDQRLFIATLAALALLFVYNQFVRSPRADETESLRTHLEALETRNATARAIEVQQGGPQLAARVVELERHVALLEKLVPRKEDVPMLLRDISLRARDTRLQLTRLKPETEEAGEHYVKRTYEINVRGPYHAIGMFLGEVGSLSRIMTPIELRMLPDALQKTRDGAPVLNANFRLLTYIVPPAGESPKSHVSQAVVAALQAAPPAPAEPPRGSPAAIAAPAVDASDARAAAVDSAAALALPDTSGGAPPRPAGG